MRIGFEMKKPEFTCIRDAIELIEKLESENKELAKDIKVRDGQLEGSNDVIRRLEVENKDLNLRLDEAALIVDGMEVENQRLKKQLTKHKTGLEEIAAILNRLNVIFREIGNRAEQAYLRNHAIQSEAILNNILTKIKELIGG